MQTGQIDAGTFRHRIGILWGAQWSAELTGRALGSVQTVD